MQTIPQFPKGGPAVSQTPHRAIVPITNHHLSRIIFWSKDVAGSFGQLLWMSPKMKKVVMQPPRHRVGISRVYHQSEVIHSVTFRVAQETQRATSHTFENDSN